MDLLDIPGVYDIVDCECWLTGLSKSGLELSSSSSLSSALMNGFSIFPRDFLVLSLFGRDGKVGVADPS